MLLFWMTAAGLTAGAVLWMAARAADAARRASAEDEPADLSTYRRQLAELDELAARGLLG